MPAANARSRVVVVTGDLTIDWNLARTRRDKGEGSAWNADDSTRAYWQRGGATLVADLASVVAEDIAARGSEVWDVRQMASPTDAVRPQDLPCHHSYAILKVDEDRSATPEVV